MRLLTFNLWHGFNPQGWIHFPHLEPDGRRQLREELQLEILASLDADLMCLQEVNPLGRREREFVSALSGISVQSQADASGLKWLGLGFPFNLSTGLMTMTGPRLKSRRLGHAKLSGGVGQFVGKYFSLQAVEARYALISEVQHTKWGKMLVVNAHLHHGLHLTGQLLRDLGRLHQEAHLTESAYEELLERLRLGEARRLEEVKRLLEEIDRRRSKYDRIILAGDLNITEDCEGYRLIREVGFTDLGVGEGFEGHTWDPRLNENNHRFMQSFPLAVTIEDLTFSEQTRAKLLQLLKAVDQRPRRIDYLLVWSRDGQGRVERRQLIGQPNEFGIAPSDHFGLVVDYLWE